MKQRLRILGRKKPVAAHRLLIMMSDWADLEVSKSKSGLINGMISQLVSGAPIIYPTCHHADQVVLELVALLRHNVHVLAWRENVEAQVSAHQSTTPAEVAQSEEQRHLHRAAAAAALLHAPRRHCADGAQQLGQQAPVHSQHCFVLILLQGRLYIKTLHSAVYICGGAGRLLETL